MTYIRRHGRLIAVDDDYVVQDGESIVTPSMFMDQDLDNVQRVYDGSRLHDGLGHPTGHKPGFVSSHRRIAKRRCASLRRAPRVANDRMEERV